MWKFTLHVLLKPRLKDFVHYLTSMLNEPSYNYSLNIFGITLLWDWNKN